MLGAVAAATAHSAALVAFVGPILTYTHDLHAAPGIFVAVFAHFHVAQNRTMVMRAPIGGRCRPNDRK